MNQHSNCGYILYIGKVRKKTAENGMWNAELLLQPHLYLIQACLQGVLITKGKMFSTALRKIFSPNS